MVSIAGMKVKPAAIAKAIPRANIGPRTWYDRSVAEMSMSMANIVVRAEENIAGPTLDRVSAIARFEDFPCFKWSLNREDMNNM